MPLKDFDVSKVKAAKAVPGVNIASLTDLSRDTGSGAGYQPSLVCFHACFTCHTRPAEPDQDRRLTWSNRKGKHLVCSTRIMLVKANLSGYPRQAGSNTTRYIFAIISPGSGETGKRPLDQSALDASERKESHVNCQVPANRLSTVK